ncbi:hypothetical protein NQ318_007286, partial [Aromia moschata]
RTLALAQELGDQAIEAQASIEYHLRHLLIAQNLSDQVGEGRACWSLGNAHASLGNHEKALSFAKKHLELSKELGDPMGEATAKMNISDLKKILNIPESPDNDTESPSSSSSSKEEIANNASHHQLHRVRRESMEQLSLIKLTPDSKRPGLSLPQAKPATPIKNEDEDSFFDLLSRFQSKRMDDQRCSLTLDNNKENTNVVNLPHKDGPEDLIEMIAGMQSKRMDEQRVSLPHLPGLQTNSLQRLAESRNNSIPDDNFLDQLVRCQGSRLEDQRSPLPAPAVDAETDPPPVDNRKSGATVPDEDFFSLIMRFQSGRMDDQRASVPRVENR